MDSLLEPDQVKKAYRMYMMKLHPDRIHSEKDPYKEYIANEVFSAMLEAYNLFRAEHGIK